MLSLRQLCDAGLGTTRSVALLTMLGEARASRCFSSGWCVAAHVAALHRRLTEKSPLRGGDADALRWDENAEHFLPLNA